MWQTRRSITSKVDHYEILISAFTAWNVPFRKTTDWQEGQAIRVEGEKCHVNESQGTRHMSDTFLALLPSLATSQVGDTAGNGRAATQPYQDT